MVNRGHRTTRRTSHFSITLYIFLLFVFSIFVFVLYSKDISEDEQNRLVVSEKKEPESEEVCYILFIHLFVFVNWVICADFL